MAGIKNGDVVSISYTGKLDDGSVFDKNEEGKPLEFTMGKNEIIPGLEKALLGMKKGDKKKIKVKAAEAYGQWFEKLVRKIALSSLPPNMKIEKDMMLFLKDKDGNEMPVRVMEKDKETFTVDFNHPFAGKDLTFDVEIVSVN